MIRGHDVVMRIEGSEKVARFKNIQIHLNGERSTEGVLFEADADDAAQKSLPAHNRAARRDARFGRST